MSAIRSCFTPISKTELTLRVIVYFIAGLIVASFIVLLGFLYQRFYLTLTQAEEVVILQSQLAINSLNVDLYLSIKNGPFLRGERSSSPSAIRRAEIKNPFAK